VNTFRFQQFTVAQDLTAMKVGTDGMLLGAWAQVQGSSLLDIGTGTGIVALMLAQRYPALTIQALELDPAATAQAQANFAAAPWAERLQVKQADFCTAPLPRATDWVCNPPFFTGTQTPDHARMQARHQASLPLARIWERGAESGPSRISLILPVDIAQETLPEAEGWGWYLERRCRVRHTPVHPEKRWLMSLIRERGDVTEESLDLKQTQGGWSEAYQALTAAFHPPEYL
jgi:tRNA1Val (adenine37-N6)-methyltransferase